MLSAEKACDDRYITKKKGGSQREAYEQRQAYSLAMIKTLRKDGDHTEGDTHAMMHQPPPLPLPLVSLSTGTLDSCEDAEEVSKKLVISAKASIAKF